MLRAYWRSPGGKLGIAAVVLIFAGALFFPLFFTEAATTIHPELANQGMSSEHPLGTDSLGRDNLARLLVATRLSVTLALVATAIAAGFGTVVGVLASLFPYRMRSVVLRLNDVFLSFPAILLAIFIGAITGPGILGAMLGVGVAQALVFVRLASNLALTVGDELFVMTARVIGVRRWRLLRRHILPNCAEPLLLVTAVSVSSSIVALSALSFLGLGVQNPDFDWGSLLTDGIEQIYTVPVAAIAPAAAIAFVALAFGFVGEGLARATNPTLWVSEGQPKSRTSTVVPATEPKDTDWRSAIPYVGSAGLNGTSDQRTNGQAFEPLLEVDSLSVSFPGRGAHRVDVLKNVSFVLGRNEMLGIVGESGSGKSMTAMAIAQLLPHSAHQGGVIRFGGQDLARLPRAKRDEILRSGMAVVSQDPLASLNPALKIGPQMTEALTIGRTMPKRRARALAVRSLQDVNIPVPAEQLKRYPNVLSGGMRQRVMFAMGMMRRPALIVADEPTTALDVTVQAQVMDILKEAHESQDTAIIFISHNIELVASVCHRVIVMYAGYLVEDLTAEQLRSSPRHPYTQALMDAVPDMSTARDVPLRQIPGSVPDPDERPTGCAFHTRCPLAIARCSTEMPPHRIQHDGRLLACWVKGDA